MRRREFITLLGGAAVTWPLLALAQQPVKAARIGVLIGWAEGDPATRSLVAAFTSALAKRGWTEGRNLEIRVHWGNGDQARIERLARELVEWSPDAILGQTTPVIRALAAKTKTIPIVFVQVTDPVGSGFVRTLRKPGSNITGFTTDNSAQAGKWVQLLKEIAPQTVRVSLLFNPSTSVPSNFFMPSVESAASSLGVQASIAPVKTKDEIEQVIGDLALKSGAGLIVTPDPFNVANRDLIIRLAALHRLPAIYFNRFFADSGGLIAYGDVFVEQFREAAGYVDSIIRRNANADELPVQSPTKFELVINLKTARALGLDVAATMLERADDLLE